MPQSPSRSKADSDRPPDEVGRNRLLHCRRGMSGHATVALLSLLTRLPPPQCLNPATALSLKRANFPESRFLSATRMGKLLQEFADAGPAGGAFYDGPVGVAAREHRLPLITCDKRAERTYRALGVADELLVRTA